MNETVVSLRYAAEDDAPFLANLFSAVHYGEFAALGEPTASELLGQQFRSQQQQYLDTFDPAGDHIIDEHERPIGRLWVHCVDSQWQLVDIAILPSRQRCGIARVLLADLTAQADAHGATVRLHVATTNSGAIRLYLGQDFQVEGTTDTHLRMVRAPAPSERVG